MNMFARFDENPAMTLQDIKETKRYGRTDAHTDARTHTRTHGQRENSIPTTNKVCGGYNYFRINLPESMGLGRDQTCDPWICEAARMHRCTWAFANAISIIISKFLMSGPKLLTYLIGQLLWLGKPFHISQWPRKHFQEHYWQQPLDQYCWRKNGRYPFPFSPLQPCHQPRDTKMENMHLPFVYGETPKHNSAFHQGLNYLLKCKRFSDKQYNLFLKGLFRSIFFIIIIQV